MQRKLSMWAVVALLTVMIIFLVSSQEKVSLSPTAATARCDSKSLSNCIDGCWEDYNEEMAEITAALNAQHRNCCESSGGKWSDSLGGSCSGGDSWTYTLCVGEYDYQGLKDKSTEDRKQCVKDCQTSFCSRSFS